MDKLALSCTFKNGNQIAATMTTSINCKIPPMIELVAIIPEKKSGMVQGTITPVVAGKIPDAIMK